MIAAGPRPHHVADLAWPEVEARLAGGALALLPIGAQSKEHGYHLPLGTDALQAEWLAGQVSARLDSLVWPTLGYGYYPVFVDYPGSNSLSRGTFMAVVVEVLEGIARAGAGRIAILNTGISTIEPLEAALAQARPDPPVQLVNVYAGPRLADVRRDIEEQAYGGHADEMETSLVLAIAPQLVRMERAVGSPVRIVRGLFNRRDPAAPNYTPSGVNGDPTRASAVKGARLAAALLEDVLAMLAAAPGS